MPPRYAFWTILIDNKPTAFRAREREELLPTLQQLRRTNKDVVMKWFGRGRLWETPDEAQLAGRMADAAREKRGRDWRPGGQHRDPRDRFKKRASQIADRQTPSRQGFGSTYRSRESRPLRVLETPPKPGPSPRHKHTVKKPLPPKQR